MQYLLETVLFRLLKTVVMTHEFRFGLISSTAVILKSLQNNRHMHVCAHTHTDTHTQTHTKELSMEKLIQ